MSEMKLIMEGWRNYNADQEEAKEAQQLVEEFWRGDYCSGELILENEIKLLEEGVSQFFRDAYTSVKSKIDQFKNWSEQKLMSFVESGLEKLNSFLTKMREIAKETKNQVLLKLFPKYGTREKQDIVKVLMMPKYLRIGAAIITTFLQKAAKFGISALLDTLTAGTGTAAKISTFIKDNIEKIKLFVDGVMNALDPNGILDMIEQFDIMKDAKELIDQFKADLQGRRNPLTSTEA